MTNVCYDIYQGATVNFLGLKYNMTMAKVEVNVHQQQRGFSSLTYRQVLQITDEMDHFVEIPRGIYRNLLKFLNVGEARERENKEMRTAKRQSGMSKSLSLRQTKGWETTIETTTTTINASQCVRMRQRQITRKREREIEKGGHIKNFLIKLWECRVRLQRTQTS